MSHHSPQQPPTDHDLLVRLDERSEQWETTMNRVITVCETLDSRVKVLETDREHRIAVRELVGRLAKLLALGGPISAAIVAVWSWLHKFAASAR